MTGNGIQESLRRLNVVKAHAHEIVGVKPQQVNRVVESINRPGTYEITVHKDGKVYTQNWTPPPPTAVQKAQEEPEKAQEALQKAPETVLAEEVSVPVVAPTVVEEMEVDAPESITPEPSPVPVKRGRGRPPKAK